MATGVRSGATQNCLALSVSSREDPEKAPLFAATRLSVNLLVNQLSVAIDVVRGTSSLRCASTLRDQEHRRIRRSRAAWLHGALAAIQALGENLISRNCLHSKLFAAVISVCRNNLNG